MSFGNDAEQYAIQQNNVGVECYMKNSQDMDAAIHYFRQALVGHLAAETRMLDSNETTNFVNQQGMMDAVQERSITPEPMTDHRSQNCLDVNSSTVQDCTPYLHLTPFIIINQEANEIRNSETVQDVTSDTTTNLDSTLVSKHSTISSVKILFNLALAHQTKDRTSKKAYAIYQLAITLLSALPPLTSSQYLLLHVTVLNNCGVWCFENHDYSSMKICFEEMLDLLDDTYACDSSNVYPTIDERVKIGIFHNLRFFLQF